MQVSPFSSGHVLRALLTAASSLVIALPAAAQIPTSSDPIPLLHSDGTKHWYQAVHVPAGITWSDANAAANAAGGYLATAESIDESNIMFAASVSAQAWAKSGARFNGPWIGGVQSPSSLEPTGGWVWTELEPFNYANWSAGYPDNAAGADRIHFGGASQNNSWADAPDGMKMPGYVIEFSGPTARRTVGLLRREPGSEDGYSLISPWFQKTVYLLDPRGRAVNTWVSRYNPGMSVYMLGKGHMLRCGSTNNSTFNSAGGNGGIVEEFDWEGNVVWSFTHSSTKYCLHHDIAPMPNGNVLMIAWELKTGTEALAAGRNPLYINQDVWPEKIIEVNRAGQIVWSWHVWDHLVQDYDSTKANFGKVENHPELVDVNFPPSNDPDWLHANSIDYNPTLDQIVISMRTFDEIWVIDHSTTTAQAAGHTGGTHGKGGDLLYRWGNPLAYRAGTANDKQLFKQHDAHWIKSGLRGAGNIMIFNNGVDRPGGNSSSVDEIVPPIDTKGGYPLTGKAWGPAKASWSYTAPKPTDFYSPFVSGAQRMKNGNTLVSGGWNGHTFEVTPKNEIVWEHESPVTMNGVTKQGDEPSFNVIFRTPRYSAAELGVTPDKLQHGEVIEFHDSVLFVEGSTVPHRTAVGTTVEFELRAKDQPTKIYIMGTSVTEGLIPIDKRYVRMGYDPILAASLTGGFPSVFQRYLGVFGTNGRAAARMILPNDPLLVGTKLYTTFVVPDNTARNGFAFISNTVVVEVE